MNYQHYQHPTLEELGKFFCRMIGSDMRIIGFTAYDKDDNKILTNKIGIRLHNSDDEFHVDYEFYVDLDD